MKECPLTYSESDYLNECIICHETCLKCDIPNDSERCTECSDDRYLLSKPG